MLKYPNKLGIVGLRKEAPKVRTFTGPHPHKLAEAKQYLAERGEDRKPGVLVRWLEGRGKA